MKKSFIVSAFLVLHVNNPLFCAQSPNIPKLLAEFSKINNPRSPEYNERRIREILAIMEKVAPTRAPQLEISYLRPLSARLEQALGTSQATESRLNLELTRLQAAQRQTELQLRQSEESLRKQTAAMQQQKSEAATRQARLEQDINRLRIDYQAAQDTIAQHITRSNTTKAELAQLRQDIAAVQAALQDTRNQLAQEQQQHLNALAQLRNQLDQMVRENHALQADLTAAQNALRLAQINHAQELAQAAALQQALERELALVQTEYQTVRKQLTQLRADHETTQQALAAEITQSTARQTEIERLNHELQQHLDALTLLRNQLDQMVRENHVLQADLTAALNALRLAQINHAEELAQAAARQQTLEQERFELQQQLAQATDQLTTLQQDLHQVRTAHAVSEQALADQAAAFELERIQKRTALTQYGEQQAELEAKAAEATQEITTLKQQLADAQEGVAQLNKTKEAELAAAQETLKKTQANHAQELAQAATRQQALEQERHELQQQLAQAADQQTPLQQELDQLRTAQTQAQAQLEEQTKSIAAEQAKRDDEHAAQIKALQQELEQQKAAASARERALLDDLDAVQRGAQGKISTLKTTLKSAAEHTQDELKAQSKQTAIKQAQLDEQTKKVAADRAKRDEEHAAQIKAQQKEISALKAANSKLSYEKSELSSKLTTIAARAAVESGAAFSQIPTSSSNTMIEKRIEEHPLFSTFKLTQGIPRTINMADNKKYFLENPDQPVVAENLAKYTQPFPVDKPTPSAGIDIVLSASPADIKAAKKAAKKEALAAKDALSPEELGNKQIEELKQLSATANIPADASLADLGSSTFELMSDQGGLGGIKEEGSCGDEYDAENGTLALYVVHGTWSDNEAFAGNINTLASYNIFKFACQLAYAEKMKVQVISLSWSGSLDYYDREQVAIGQLAADFDRRIEQNKANKIWIIAHSHGCNISARAANHMYDKFNRLVDTGIFLACPTLDIPRQMDFETLYAFYSQGDFTQMGGSVQTGITRYTINTDRKVPFATPGSGRKVYNIRTQMDGLDMDHISIKWGVLPYLAKVLATIDTHFSCYYDLELNVENNEPNAMPLISIRDKDNNCGKVDPIAITRSEEAKVRFRQKHGRDMSSIGRFYITGATWLTNLAREATTGIKAWWRGGEPRIADVYLTEMPASPTPTSSSRSSSPPTPSSSSSP